MRKSGYAVYLVNKTLDLCQARGVNSVRAETGLDNIGMQKVYARCGFKHCGKIFDLEFKEYFFAYEKILIQPSL